MAINYKVINKVISISGFHFILITSNRSIVIENFLLVEETYKRKNGKERFGIFNIRNKISFVLHVNVVSCNFNNHDVID